MDDEDEERYWRYAKQPLDLRALYFPAPPKGGAHLPKFTIWHPSNTSFGSVLVPNYRDGMIQLIRHLNKRFHIRYFSAFLSNDYLREGICRFEHGDVDGTRRVVQVISDGRWEWHSEGEPLPFENVFYYRRRSIPNRLTPSIIIEYLKILGWNLEDESFWKTEADAWVINKTKFK